MNNVKMITRYDTTTSRWIMGYYQNWRWVTVASWKNMDSTAA